MSLFVISFPEIGVVPAALVTCLTAAFLFFAPLSARVTAITPKHMIVNNKSRLIAIRLKDLQTGYPAHKFFKGWIKLDG
jgi:hypothetical protein